MSNTREHLARNRTYWDELAQKYVQAGERGWTQDAPIWGI
jgi:hypothetical protein